MKYTYEMSCEVKAMLKGDMNAFHKFYLMTVNDIYFHVKLVIQDDEEVTKMMISIYRNLHMKLEKLERPEDTIQWMNTIIYRKLTDWVTVHCTVMMLEEDEGKYDNLFFDDEYIYSENMLTEAETANLASTFIPNLSPMHALTSLAYFYDSIPSEKISTLIDCDPVRVNTRTRYARRVIERGCMEYARDKILDIKRIDVSLLLLAYVALSKTYLVQDISGLYILIMDAL